jgi:hypothetical protein
MNLQDPLGRLTRCAIQLQGHNYEIIHREGKKHVNADALSRSLPIIGDLEEPISN